MLQSLAKHYTTHVRGIKSPPFWEKARPITQFQSSEQDTRVFFFVQVMIFVWGAYYG
jgi:hypothetical protein